MIFVTVGTHEQQFDRLLQKIDELREKKIIKQDIFIQSGYSTYKPKYCEYKNLISYDEMVNYVEKADIVITHGGPGSIFLPLQYNKIPIVVPRNPEFNEHVDNHQIKFTKKMESSNRIIGVYDIEELENKILNYNDYVNKTTIDINNNLDNFIKKLDEICISLIK